MHPLVSMPRHIDEKEDEWIFIFIILPLPLAVICQSLSREEKLRLMVGSGSLATTGPMLFGLSLSQCSKGGQ